MSTMDKLMDHWMGKMKPEEKEKMIEKMMEKFFTDMTDEEKQKIMEKMMSKMMDSIDMSKIMPQMMSKMMGGKGGMPSMMMQKMKSMRSGEQVERSPMPVMEKQKDFKPWECCPCRKLCEEGFKKKSKEEKKGDEGNFKR